MSTVRDVCLHLHECQSSPPNVLWGWAGVMQGTISVSQILCKIFVHNSVGVFKDLHGHPFGCAFARYCGLDGKGCTLVCALHKRSELWREPFGLCRRVLGKAQPQASVSKPT